MNDDTAKFWLGNGLLAAALLLLLYLGPIWERFGVVAMVIWVGLVAAGVTLIMKSAGGGGPGMPGD